MKVAISLLFFIAYSAAGLAAAFVLTGFDTGVFMWSLLGTTVVLTTLGYFGVRRIRANERAGASG